MRAFGLVMLLVSLYIGMTLYTKGIEQAFGGAFAPIRPISQREEPLATGLTPGIADAPSSGDRPMKLTDAVRNQVSADLAAGADRVGRAAE